MKHTFYTRYETALLAYLTAGDEAAAHQPRALAEEVVAAGLRILDLAKLHEHILVTQVLPRQPAGQRAMIIRQAGSFFTRAILELDKIYPGKRRATVHLNEVIETLSQRTVDLAASNLELKQEILQRKAAEEALKKSEQHYAQVLAESERLQAQLRHLSREILSSQEEERREISRELHDVIAQTLTGINVRLAALKKQASVNTKGLDRAIASTQRLVERSVNIVHEFARELRPALLDDLGLIPALHSFVKNYSKRTRIPVRMKVFAGVEQLDNQKRTVLYRVAQESLTNVARHAKATRVDMDIHKLAEAVSMEIKDDGKSFQVERKMHGKGSKRLGLLGMRERVEMVGGTFCVESAPGKGTSIRVEIPFCHVPKDEIKKSGNHTLRCP